MGRFSGKHVAGMFVTGAAVGAALAMLYAPKSGERTRRDIRRFTRKSINRLEDLQEDLRCGVSDWVENVGDVVKDGLNNGKKISSDTYHHVMGVFDSAKQAVEDGKHRLEKIIRTAS